MKNFFVLLVLGCVVSLSGCRKGNNLSPSVNVMEQKAQDFISNYKALIAEECNADPDCISKNKITLLKISNQQPNWVVIKFESYSGGTGNWVEDTVGFNLSNYTVGGDFQAWGKTLGPTDFADKLIQVGSDYRDPNTGTLYSEDTESNKDLESIGSIIENQSAQQLGETLVAHFGMSEERAQEVAKLTNAYQKITSKRALTDSEMDTLTKQLCGVSYQQAKKAFQEKAAENSGSYEDLLDKAAEKNGISPEAVGQLIEQIL